MTSRPLPMPRFARRGAGSGRMVRPPNEWAGRLLETVPGPWHTSTSEVCNEGLCRQGAAGHGRSPGGPARPVLYHTGEPVTVEEVFEAVGLTPPERHVLMARTLGRSYGEIAGDDALRKADGAAV